LAFGLMIALLRNISKSSQSVMLRKWDYLPFMGQEIRSLSLGIIGLGRLGKFMAHFGKSFGMKVYFYDPYVKSKKYHKVSLINLFKISDVISIHTHVNENTKYLVNKNLLKHSKRNQIIINTSRGEIVKEKDIVSSLRNKNIYGYGADVVEDEFKNIKKSIIINNMDNLNIIVTPHIGGMTSQGQLKAWNYAVNKFKSA
jgi:D-3-phosphoglycerate dehydrogenase / 2-oxoglutarate reductase